ncbi:MAG TPA: 4-hydroxy-tetrahydrodipicolinate reductase [Candidatus Eisenbacteria bacterium]|nr:4-hydroxy-tetrahydrodipicolinate reductase [Candidatus Eisenbacteria bacterium]
MAQVPILLHGATGRMGRAVRDCLAEFPEVKLVACVAPREQAPGPAPGPLWLTPEELTTRRRREEFPADLVVIDFSLAAGTQELLKTLALWPRALVCGTTGLSPELERSLETLATRVPVFRASNLSLGNALVETLLRALPRHVVRTYTADIVEHHHAGKKDAPSGTAITLARVLGEAGAVGQEGAEIRIQSIRSGTVPGTHHVILGGAGETIEIVHTVTDRGVFARGALRAARFIHGRAPGRYKMDDILLESA